MALLAAARDPVGPGPARLSVAVRAVDARIPLNLAGRAEVPIDVTALVAILTRLVRNAAVHGATCLRVEPLGRGFSVSDDGPGAARGHRGRIVDPFFTTRRDQGGTGMGLAILRIMLPAAGRRIEVAPSPSGARFDITFPD